MWTTSSGLCMYVLKSSKSLQSCIHCFANFHLLGQFGMVCKGIYRRSHDDEGLEVAIKTIKASEATDDFLKEMRVMSKLIHPNIVRFHGLVHQKGM